MPAHNIYVHAKWSLTEESSHLIIVDVSIEYYAEMQVLLQLGCYAKIKKKIQPKIILNQNTQPHTGVPQNNWDR